tara:strand:- start:667 stop:801 length:135 start_codon:yes stop_codon:yes gene_type:complete
VAKQGIVLLRNERNVLPLAKTAKRIAVIEAKTADRRKGAKTWKD